VLPDTSFNRTRYGTPALIPFSRQSNSRIIVPAYAVKHLVSEHGPLARIMKDVKKTPYSFTSREPEASDAATGRYIYVIEVRLEKGVPTYWLGYKYRAHEKVRPAGGSPWKGGFKYKNSARWGEPATGVYFEEPIHIADPGLCEWLAEKQPGMAEIPEHLQPALDARIESAADTARSFA
jgi:hypothetical protein